MSIIDKTKENPLVSILIVCTVVISIAVSSTTWICDQQKKLITGKYELSLERKDFQQDKYKSKIKELKEVVENCNTESLKRTFEKKDKIVIGEYRGESVAVEVERKDQEIVLPINTGKTQKKIHYSHVIYVSGADGISLRTRVLNKKELFELSSGKIDNNTYIITLMNGQRIQILSKDRNWYKVKTIMNGNIYQGYISGYYKKVSTVKEINTLLLWKGKWYTTWKNPMSYNSLNNQFIEFYNNDISTFFGKYTYHSKKSKTIEGKIYNIEFRENNLVGEWIEKSSEGYEICRGNLEFLLFSDTNSFIGRFDRKCEDSVNYRIWKGERGTD